MFQFSGLALFRVTHLQCARLSHSEIFGLSLVCSYPKLIAAYHVLHRLLVPRHPPYALIRFKYCIIYFLCRVTDSVHYFLPYYLPCTLCSEAGKNCFPNMSKNFSQFDNSAISQFVNEIVILMDLNQMQALNLYIFNHYYTQLNLLR